MNKVIKLFKNKKLLVGAVLIVLIGVGIFTYEIVSTKNKAEAEEQSLLRKQAEEQRLLIQKGEEAQSVYGEKQVHEGDFEKYHPAQYVDKWVVDRPTRNESILSGYECECGETK